MKNNNRIKIVRPQNRCRSQINLSRQLQPYLTLHGERCS